MTFWGCEEQNLYPRRDAKGREELQNLYPRRATKGGEELQNLFPRRDVKGREELKTFIREGTRRTSFFCCLNQDLREFDGFSGWGAVGCGLMFGTRLGWAKHFGTGTMLERGHLVDEAGVEGALRGRSPCTREAACGRPPETAVVGGRFG